MFCHICQLGFYIHQSPGLTRTHLKALRPFWDRRLLEIVRRATFGAFVLSVRLGPPVSHITHPTIDLIQQSVWLTIKMSFCVMQVAGIYSALFLTGLGLPLLAEEFDYLVFHPSTSELLLGNSVYPKKVGSGLPHHQLKHRLSPKYIMGVG